MDDTTAIRSTGMNLDKVWDWGQKKLQCRMKVESGNPAADALRDDLHKKLAELANINLQDLLSEMKKKKGPGMERKVREIRTTSFVLGSSKHWDESLKSTASSIYLEKDDSKYDADKPPFSASLGVRNVHKKFFSVPKSPPKRVLIDLARERSKPPITVEGVLGGAEIVEKVEIKPTKKKQTRRSAIEIAAQLEKSMTMESTSKVTISKRTTKFKDYTGDKFSNRGEYMEGMLYLSRMQDSVGMNEGSRKLRNIVLSPDKDGKSLLGSGDQEHSDTHDAKEASEDHGEDNNSTSSDISTKLYCAASLCNWSRIPQNAQQLANEGAVRAIMQLCNESNPKILKFCAAAFRYMSDSLILGGLMIEENAIAVMSDLVSNANSEFISGSVVIALVNLTRIAGKEGQLVDFGMVLAIQNVITIRPDLNAACARALYNLTCVDNSYPSIERVIRVLVSLSSSGASTVKHVCAAALCNLADIKTARLRMVEEGVISVLSALARGSETKTRRVCAVILQNLSATKACRVEMVSRNCVQVAYGLSSDQDPIVLRCIGITLARLAQEEANCARMINEGGISALCNIAIKYPIVPGISQTVASAMQLISSHTKLQFSLVSEGSVTAIASLLRLSTDIITLQQSLLALCNVLSSKDTHLSIVQQGMLNTLMTLSEHDNELMRSLCTLAFLNLSTNEDSYKHIINSGAVTSLIVLSTEAAPIIRRRCSAALCNVANYEAGIQRMISDDIVPALVRLLDTKDVETVRNVCAALCRLCNTVENGTLILESGAITHVVQGAITGDTVTRQYCGSLLSVLTAYDSCRLKLMGFGVMDALRSLSDQDDNTKQRCLVAFANLSCESSLHEEMISKGVIGIISKLVNSYQELNQICCATAICNLAYVGSRLKILVEGGLQALLMISMVRSVNNHTKMLCVVALGNLFEESTMDFLLNEGLVGSVANLCKVPDEKIGNLGAKMFNQFSLSERGRAKLADKSNVLTTLFNMINSANEHTRVLCAHTTCNLVMSEAAIRTKCIKFGALNALAKGMQLANEGASLHCVKAVNAIALIIQFRWMIAKTKLPEMMVEVAMGCSGEKHDRCVKVICMLAWANGSRFMLQNLEMMRVVVELVTHNLQASSALWVAYILQYLTFAYYDHYELLQIGIFPAIQKLLGHSSEELLQCTAWTIRSLLETSTCVPELANEHTVAIFQQVVEQVRDEETLYNVAVSLYKFAEHSAESRLKIATISVCQILTSLIQYPACHGVAAAMIYLFTNDAKCVYTFANKTVVAICAHIVEHCSSEEVLTNTVTSLYCMSKLPVGRVLLSGPPSNVDMKLMTLLKACSPVMKANCSRVLKNLSSDASEDIEDGAVAALIALSFDPNKPPKQPDSVISPKIVAKDAKSFRAPACTRELIPFDIFVEEHVVQKCGDVGRGPRPPDPPLIGFEGAKDIPNIMDEIESGEGNDGRTLMTFAKMQIPQSLRENYLLTDDDFELHAGESQQEDYEWDDEPPVDQEASGYQQHPQGEDEGKLLSASTEEDATAVANTEANKSIPALGSDSLAKSTGKGVPSTRKEQVPLKEIASLHGLY